MSRENLDRVQEIFDSALSDDFSATEIPQAVDELVRFYSETDNLGWQAIHAHLAYWAPRMDGNLDGAECLVGLLAEAATAIDPGTSPGLHARALGIAACVPFPDFSGFGTWDMQWEAHQKELSFLEAWLFEGTPLTITDLSFMSDIARSAGVGPLTYMVDHLGQEPLDALRVYLPASGETLQSMTAVSLLVSSHNLARDTSNAISEAGVLVNPRLIHLYCDEGNLLQPWWQEMMEWSPIIDLWKALNDIALTPGVNSGFLLEQLQRSTSWTLYSDPHQAQVFGQDQELFESLTDFLRSLDD